jgi:flagellar L-ring protein FlgH
MNKVSWLLYKALLLVIVASTPQLRADSLWQLGQSRAIVADRRAFLVGDILSITVQENSTATKDNSTKTARESSVDASISTFLYNPASSGLLTKGGKLPAMSFAGKQNFEGSGKINNSEQIIARIAVEVIDVLPNMNLVVEGRRMTAFSGETQEIVLRGVVRPADITANNTVYSYNVADATIRINSKGTVTDNTRKGWFTRIWEKVSPF